MRQELHEVVLGDGTRVCFATAGEGPVLLYVPGWLSHLEASWALPPERRFYEALARGRTLVRYDRPGAGLSGASAGDVVEVELETIAAVAGALDVHRFDVVGTSLGAPLAVRWAARQPARVGRLVLYGGWAHGADTAAPEVRTHVLGLVEQHWGLGSDVLTEIFAPEADAGLRAAFSRYQRDASSAEGARRLLAACYEIDVRDELGLVAAPTTVVHRRDDRAAPLAGGQALADGIPDAKLVVVAGRSHLPYVGDPAPVVAAIRRGLGMPVGRPRATELTPRQREVAALVAQGLTNRQIAERLVITERSAESHVERIRLRLGVRSRAQVAAWFATGEHEVR